MKLTTVSIHNFRGVLDQTFTLQDYSLLIGPNNSGKTSVIDALRAFYSTSRSALPATDSPLIQTADQDSWIELTFQLDDDEDESLADQYRTPDKLLRVRKILRWKTDKDRKANTIYGYTTDGLLNSEQFYGTNNVQQGKLGHIVYIEAISTVGEQSKLGGPSPLRDLLEGIISNVAKHGAAYPSLQESVQVFSEHVQHEETEDGRSLEGFASALNLALSSWNTSFRLDIHTPAIKDLLRSMVNWELVDGDHGQAQSAEQYGSGFQRFFIYSLIRLAAEYVTKRPPSETRDFTPDLTLILFEEPEAFLHPHSQEELARSLKDLASSTNWQVLCATHSSLFVSNNTSDIPSLIRMARENGEVIARQLTQLDWHSLVNDNQTATAGAMGGNIDPIDQTIEMEAIKYFLWLNPDRASLFFAAKVLLVEGPTEVALINRLVDDNMIGPGIDGLYIMDCMGKYNIHRFMNLLARLGIPHGVLHDRDGDKPQGKPYQFNAEIANAANSYTHHIEQVTETLEEFLGLDKSVKPYRKPQLALYKYETAAISSAKIKSFCDMVKRCIPT